MARRHSGKLGFPWCGSLLLLVPWLIGACSSDQPSFARGTDTSGESDAKDSDEHDASSPAAPDTDDDTTDHDTDGATESDTDGPSSSDTDPSSRPDASDDMAADTDESDATDPEAGEATDAPNDDADSDDPPEDPPLTDVRETDEETDTDDEETDTDDEETDAPTATDASETEEATDGTDESTDDGCQADNDCNGSLVCAASGECVECLLEGDERPGATACGINGAGTLLQQCIDGWWLDGTECVDPDECVNGTITTCGAEFGALGVCADRSITCTNGTYSDATCAGGEEICAPDGLDEDCDGEVNEAPCETYARFEAADRHACALTSLGRVLCWGNNDFGQVASTNPDVQTTPTPVFGMTNVRSVAVGNQNSCAVFNDDSARCWGTNDNGELGDGTSSSPGLGAIVVVDVVSGIRQMLPGNNASCAVLTNGTVECWGRDSDPTVTDPISGLTDVVSADVAPGGSRFCAILQGGSVSCWGWNDDAAVPISGVAGATQLGVGDAEACARLSSGSVVCWSSTTATSKGLTSAVEVDAGRDSSCAVLTDGSVYCWGDYYGVSPVAIEGIQNATSISVGDTYGCVTKSDGTASCFGNNLNGQLGNPDTQCCSLDVLETWFDPVPVHGP